MFHLLCFSNNFLWSHDQRTFFVYFVLRDCVCLGLIEKNSDDSAIFH